MSYTDFSIKLDGNQVQLWFNKTILRTNILNSEGYTNFEVFFKYTRDVKGDRYYLRGDRYVSWFNKGKWYDLSNYTSFAAGEHLEINKSQNYVIIAPSSHIAITGDINGIKTDKQYTIEEDHINKKISITFKDYRYDFIEATIAVQKNLAKVFKMPEPEIDKKYTCFNIKLTFEPELTPDAKRLINHNKI